MVNPLYRGRCVKFRFEGSQVGERRPLATVEERAGSQVITQLIIGE
jgi:hypothetical protein